MRPRRVKDRLLKSWPKLQIRITQLVHEGSPPTDLRLPQAKFSLKKREGRQKAANEVREQLGKSPC